MPISNYPQGFSQGVTIRGVPVTMAHPGKVFFVNNSAVVVPYGIGGANGNDGTYTQPFQTIAYAVTQCLAGRGDIIFVMPGHVETVATAAAININKTGVAIVGLGMGNLRPQLNFTATAATVTITAANCSMKNILCTGGIDAVAAMIVVSAADCTIDNCEMRDVTGQMTLGILTTAAADRLKIIDHVHKGDTAAGTAAAIRLVGGDSIEITAKVMDGNFSVGGIDIATTATTNLYVHDVGRFYTRNAADIFLIDTITASTGQIGPNINIRLTDNAANITEAITGATFVVQDPVYVVNAPNEKGMLINWVASTDA